MRRVVVSPTFVAGLGVVVAAMLAYPMRTVFNYAAPNAAPCGTSCGSGIQAGGEPASVPGQQLNQTGQSGAHGVGKPPGGRAGRRSGAGHDDGHAQAPPPRLSYQASGRGHEGFDGTIMMTFRRRSARDSWWLRFGYPSARIVEVWGGGRELEHSRHSAVVASWDWPDNGSAGRMIRVSILVAGRAGPPLRCSFNGRPCHISEHRGQRPGAGRRGG